MTNAINSNEQMIEKINEVLQNKKDAVVNIVNDKLTISVFSLLEKNLHNVKEINFVIRDVKFLPLRARLHMNLKSILRIYCLIRMILRRKISYSISPKHVICMILYRST